MDPDFNENQPIYLQIIQHIYAMILRGDYRPGDKLPSVIDTAMFFKVNHNTVARAYSEMVRSDIAIIRRGEGTFVTEDQEVLDKLHDSMRQSLLGSFLTEMRRLGYSPSEVIETLKIYIQNNENGKNSGEN